MNRPIWRQPAFIILVLLNLAAAIGVALDLRGRLGAPPTAPAPAGAGPPPTLIPAPTPVAGTPRPASPTPTRPLPTATPLPPANLPHTLIADDRFTYAPDFYTAEVQAFLEEQGSVLARSTIPLGDGEDSFAHALVGQCIRYSLNPKVLLALLEVQSGLVRGREGGAEGREVASRLDYAFGYRQAEWRGLGRQLEWAAYTLAVSFRREGLVFPRLTDGKRATVPSEANAATRALLRLLAYTADSRRFARLRSSDEGSFVVTYRELFGEDPRMPLESPPPPAQEPFLWPPYGGSPVALSYFDHEYPTFEESGTILTYSGERGHGSYDGHDGWDYALPAGSPVLAAAAGRVVFAGFLDTGCATPAGLVVLDHGQGYRTLYWHLEGIEVAEGQEVRRGARLGTTGSTGCSSGPHLHLGVEFLGRDVDPYGWCGSPTTPEDPWAVHPAGAPSRWLWANRPSPCPMPAGAIVVDEEGAGFEKSPALWHEAPVGYGGHAFWTLSTVEAARSIHRGVWRPNLPEAGRYFLYAHIPWYDTGHPDTARARYHIRHANGETTLTVSQADSAGLWLLLGEYYFAQGTRGYVYLDEATGEEGKTVWFDALVWVRE